MQYQPFLSSPFYQKQALLLKNWLDGDIMLADSIVSPAIWQYFIDAHQQQIVPDVVICQSLTNALPDKDVVDFFDFLYHMYFAQTAFKDVFQFIKTIANNKHRKDKIHNYFFNQKKAYFEQLPKELHAQDAWNVLESTLHGLPLNKLYTYDKLESHNLEDVHVVRLPRILRPCDFDDHFFDVYKEKIIERVKTVKIAKLWTGVGNAKIHDEWLTPHYLPLLAIASHVGEHTLQFPILNEQESLHFYNICMNLDVDIFNTQTLTAMTEWFTSRNALNRYHMIFFMTHLHPRMPKAYQLLPRDQYRHNDNLNSKLLHYAGVSIEEFNLQKNIIGDDPKKLFQHFAAGQTHIVELPLM